MHGNFIYMHGQFILILINFLLSIVSWIPSYYNEMNSNTGHGQQGSQNRGECTFIIYTIITNRKY